MWSSTSEVSSRVSFALQSIRVSAHSCRLTQRDDLRYVLVACTGQRHGLEGIVTSLRAEVDGFISVANPGSGSFLLESPRETDRAEAHSSSLAGNLRHGVRCRSS